MQPGDKGFSVGVYTDSLGVPRHYLNQVTLIEVDAGGRLLVEERDGSRFRLLRSQSLAATEAEAKLMAAEKLDALARPYHEQAERLRAEAVALAAAEQVVTT